MKKILIIFFLPFFFSSCIQSSVSPSKEGLTDESDPRLEILSWSYESSTAILLSSKDVKLEEYGIRQGNTKKFSKIFFSERMNQQQLMFPKDFSTKKRMN